MAFSDATKLNISFKKLAGKAQTDNAKAVSNEAKGSAPTVVAASIPALSVPSSPSASALYTITTSGAPAKAAVEFLRLPLVADPSSNGLAFFATLPTAYQTASANVNKGTGSFLNNAVLVDTAGKLQVIPPLYGITYEAKPYVGGTTTQGSGTLIPPGDARDWYFDYFNGVFFQQTVGTTPAYIEIFLYIGSMISDSLDELGAQSSNTGSSMWTAGQALNKGQVVKITGASTVLGTIYSETNTSIIGIAEDNASNGSQVRVAHTGRVVSGFSGLIPGAKYFLSATGDLTSTPPTGAGSLTRMGYAKSSTEFLVLIGDSKIKI